MANIAVKRLGKELMELNGAKTDPPAGITLLSGDNFKEWRLGLEVLGESLYKGEKFALVFKFGNRYPIEAPAVMFIVDDVYHAPLHPHVYSNGMICASILGNEWSPVLNVAAVCITLQSMLASCKEKTLPEDNDSFVRTAPSDPRKVRFVYHDDTV
ncbi:hypothetical protein FRB94_004163 [Tulasnella sp. JGI-2019a]|nr:hypothetical protein FRB93_003548 [Tulasnella sp. JGI-2019a]KAG9002013.1 hypothetical protein FRB94_004163 [Tulasnella sp. JGI-2019a]KAG9037290.1 hypothetical protein FRB95_006233 [Tulasnella sp. JGI-2019a]